MKIQLLTKSAQMPTRAHDGDAGFDLYADQAKSLSPGEWAQITTGIAIELEKDVAGLVLPRSGLAAKHGISIVNSPGLIDPPYRGEVAVILKNGGAQRFSVEPGMRIAQLLLVPFQSPELEIVQKLTKSNRGSKGFGSSGK